MKQYIVAILFLCHQCAGFLHPWLPKPLQKSSVRMSPTQLSDITDERKAQTSDEHNIVSSSKFMSRRDLTKSIATSLISAGFLSSPACSTAAEPTIWKTGRSPEVPGQKPKDKSDTKGTRKDPNFLRSIADCKGKCENSPGPDGLARSSAECLSSCQDICCTTYEQCTFAIVAR